MQADIHIYNPSKINDAGHDVIRRLSVSIDQAAIAIESIRGKADTIELAFHPPERGAHPKDQVIGTPCCAIVVSMSDKDGDKRIESIGEKKLALTVFIVGEGIVIVPYTVGNKIPYSWEGRVDEFAPRFAKGLLDILMAENL